MPDYVILGRDETDQEIRIGDIERRSGLYILGRPRSGKTTLIKNIIAQDIDNAHGLFFLDPHGDAIEDLLTRIPAKRQDDVFVIDPTDETYTFGMNLLACSDITSWNEREKIFDRAIGIFTKLFANPQTGILDVLLDKYLRNSFYPLIANQGYTIAEIPLVLTDPQFRNHLLQHPILAKDYPEVARFWHTEFTQLSPNDQRTEIQSTLTRLGSFTRPYIQHIVGQSQTRLDFTDIMDNRKILFVKLSSNLSVDHRRIIGTILVSHLVSAVFQRDKMPEGQRRHFCIFIDEFQNFAGSEDFAILFTQGRKFAVATTIAHQERFGQFADNRVILGATDAAGNKVFFQLAVRDADEQAPEVTKASPTETRLERQLGISQEPFTDLLRGHTNPDIHRFIQTYLRPLHYQLQDTQDDIEGDRLLRLAILDEAALSRVDERYVAIEASQARGRALHASYDAVHKTEQLLVQVQAQTERLRQLYERARSLKLSMRSLNTFLTEIMEGRMQPEPGHELFSHFLLAFVPRTVTLPASAAQVFATYISLVYGNPHLPRAIPLSLSARYLGASHEELYRHVEAQYISQVQAYAEKSHQEAQEEWDEQRQDHYEGVVRRIMTWKHLQAWWSEGYGECFQMLKHRQVRTLLTPYFFAKFTPPWYYHDPKGRPPDFVLPSDPTPDEQAAVMFLQQYGEGACVTLELLRCALRNTGYNFDPIRSWPRKPDPNALPLMIPSLNLEYGHLHMLQLPAIAGMEPFHVWQVTTQLMEICDSIRNPHNYQRDRYWRGGRPPILLDRRHDAQLLLAQLDPYFPDVEYLRQWWDWLTDEDMRRIGRQQDALISVLIEREGSGRVSHVTVAQRVSAYREDKRRQIGQAGQAALVPTMSGGIPFVLPYVLDRMWHRCDEMARTYLIARACDWVTYGDVIADRTFPQPTLAGIPPQEVSAAVAALMQLLLEAQAQVDANRERAWARRKEAFVWECLWKYDGILRLQVYQAEGRVHLRQTVERSLPPRVLSAAEIDRLTASCLNELPDSESLVATLEAFVRFCQLLRQPQNHVRSYTAQYVERQVNTYTTAEMRNQMAQELINLHPHSAYMKSTWKGKIQTLDISGEPGALLSAGRGDLVDVRQGARRIAIDARILRQRGEIEEEIRERQDNWRRRPGNEPPPPTSTGGNSPPSLPLASAGNDPEPPTDSLPEKPPGEMQPQDRNWAAEKGSQINDQPPLSSEKTPARKPSPAGSSEGRKEGAVLKRRAGQKKEHEELKRNEKYAALREKLIPIIQQALVRYEEKSKTEMNGWMRKISLNNAAICALALRDKVAAKRLLQQFINSSNDYRELFVGRFAILLGDEDKAKGVIQSIEDRYEPKDLHYPRAAYIAADLPDKTTAKRLMRKIENQGRISSAVEIAVKIGDKETIARIMQETKNKGLNNIGSYETLSLLAPFHPKIALNLLKRHEEECRKQNMLDIVGKIAAVCGDRATAKRVMNELKDKGDFYHCCDIAAIMGDVATAEAMMWEYKKKDESWFNSNYEHLRFTVNTHNPQARYHLLQALAKQGYEVGLIAARILENLGSPQPTHTGVNPHADNSFGEALGRG